MTVIRFTRDFRGRATNEQYFEAGTVIDLPTGDQVITEGAAELFDGDYTAPVFPDAKPEAQAEQAPDPARSKLLWNPEYEAENKAIEARELEKALAETAEKVTEVVSEPQEVKPAKPRKTRKKE